MRFSILMVFNQWFYNFNFQLVFLNNFNFSWLKITSLTFSWPWSIFVQGHYLACNSYVPKQGHISYTDILHEVMHAHQLSILTPHPAEPNHHSNKGQTSSLTSCVYQSNNQSLEPTSTPILQLDSTLYTHLILQSLSLEIIVIILKTQDNAINSTNKRSDFLLSSPSPSVGFKRLVGLNFFFIKHWSARGEEICECFNNYDQDFRSARISVFGSVFRVSSPAVAFTP